MGRRREARHPEVVSFYRRLLQQGGRVYTSDYVLDETITLLFRRESPSDASRFLGGIFEASAQGRLTVESISSIRFSEAWSLRQRFLDKPLISFTDLGSMVVMKELGIQDILTEDDHFLHIGMGFRKVP
jgi:predicted nucleic acid-binding protein